MTTTADHYQQARTAALVVQHPAPEALLVSGGDRLDLLHRMSTNAVDRLATGEARVTVLTNALGRIVDAVTVLQGDTRALLVTSPGRGQEALEWLQGYIFFNDDVQLELIEPPLSAWGVYGPNAARELDRLDQPEGRTALLGDEALWAAWRAPEPLEGWRLLLAPDAAAQAEAIWGQEASSDAVQQAYEALRIEAGLPQAEREYAPDMTPLEAGLEFAVDSEKGCYIGQEIIARMLSRDQVPRRIMGVELSGPAEAGEELRVDGERIGTLTSAVESPARGWIGLATVRSRSLPAAGEVRLAKSGVTGALRSLPFD